jgi:hypothetical protein
MVRVYINRHVVAANQKSGARNPPIAILRRKAQREYALEVELIGTARVVYSPDKPLSCDARVWIECDEAMAINPVAIAA